jgi:hypothetical protein
VQREQVTGSYIQEVASTGSASPADELAKLGQLRDSAVITAEEFAAQ